MHSVTVNQELNYMVIPMVYSLKFVLICLDGFFILSQRRKDTKIENQGSGVIFSEKKTKGYHNAG